MMTPILMALALGLSSSMNLGEHPGLLVRASLETPRVSLVTMVDTSPKYTGIGWRFSQQADVRIWGALYGGAEYARRAGGSWVKQSIRVRGGLRVAPGLEVGISRDIWQDTPPTVTMATVRYGRQVGMVRIGGEAGVVRYLGHTGGYSMLWAGIGHTPHSWSAGQPSAGTGQTSPARH